MRRRAPTSFRVFVRSKGGTAWTTLDWTVEGRTQEQAKREAAQRLDEIEEYRAAIQGEGLELAVAAARSFNRVLVRTEPQPAKIVLR